jgi:hypothetical protein
LSSSSSKSSSGGSAKIVKTDFLVRFFFLRLSLFNNKSYFLDASYYDRARCSGRSIFVFSLYLFRAIWISLSLSSESARASMDDVGEREF